MNSESTCFVSSYQHRSRDLSILAGCPEGFFQRGHYEQWKKQDQSSIRSTTQHYDHEFSLVLILYSYSNLWASIFDPLEPPHCCLSPQLESAEVFGVVSRDSHIGCQILRRQIRVALWLHPSTCLYLLSSHELARGEDKNWPQAQFELSHERAALASELGVAGCDPAPKSGNLALNSG
jgi:hypothetical protein